MKGYPFYDAIAADAAITRRNLLRTGNSLS
jgi:hypothetical protein